ncbi:MAG: T9SS type A sorting domain-containing protein, partial [Bacteroidetes bacterium]|nr:T9SS type A sorting domain-containing protein [Bacteroidota bacterium]
ISGTNPICSGNSTTLSVGNTCVGCTYTWSTGTTGAQITASTAGTYRVTATNSCGTISSDAYTLTVNATPQPAINNLSNTYCLAASNVTLTGTPSGGTFGGMVQSGNIFSPSNAGNGTHNVTYTVTQNGCSATVTQQVLVSSAPIVQVTTFDSTTFCTGGSATLTATQGTAYSWTNGATTQSITINQSGSYHVTVTNPGGCPNSVIVANSPVTVTVNPNPIASAGVDQNLLLVAGNSVTLGGAPTASAGTAPYTYQWLPVAGLDNSTNANPIVSNINSNTTYSLFVTDANGCADTDTVNVTTTAVCSYTVQPNYFAFAASGGIDSFYVDAVGSNCTLDVSTCPWLSITSPALPNTGSAWVYFNTSTNTTNQQRTCTITLTGGQTIVVTQQGTPQVNPCNPPLNAPTVSLNACDLAATNVPSLSYQWYLNGNLIPNANTRFHTADTTGYYYVVVADSNFCTAQSADVYVAYPACQAVGINEVVNEFIFDIYPSPANEAITVRISEPNSTLNLYDAAGRLVQSFHINNAIQNINISELANGVYYARTNNHSAIKKFIKL